MTTYSMDFLVTQKANILLDQARVASALADVENLIIVTAATLTTDGQAALLVVNKLSACLQVDLDVDKIYQDAVGNRVTEYQLARDQALAYQAAGYTGTVPVTVQHWADLNAQTTHWSADNILAQSVAWAGAQLTIRDHRLTAKSQARAAIDQPSLDTVMTGWNGFVTYIRTALGI